jgi:hypothetical protein
VGASCAFYLYTLCLRMLRCFYRGLVYKTYIMRILAHLYLLALLSCNGPQPLDQRCVKGRYITNYCGGIVVQILDGTPIGRDWKDISDQTLPNCVVASLDTLAFRNLTQAALPQPDSTFYFRYREGGYPQKAFILCHPAPFITITAASGTSCQ